MADKRSYAGFKFKQDMPPAGGYQEILWQRTYPKTWANAKRLFAGTAVFCVYGWFQWYHKTRNKNSCMLQDSDDIIAMTPFIKAERDRYFLKVMRKNRDLETEVMKDVPGWQAGTWYGEPIYYTLGDHWFDPNRKEIMVHGTYRNNERAVWFSEHMEYAAPKWYDKYLPQWLLDHIY